MWSDQNVNCFADLFSLYADSCQPSGPSGTWRPQFTLEGKYQSHRMEKISDRILQMVKQAWRLEQILFKSHSLKNTAGHAKSQNGGPKIQDVRPNMSFSLYISKCFNFRDPSIKFFTGWYNNDNWLARSPLIPAPCCPLDPLGPGSPRSPYGAKSCGVSYIRTTWCLLGPCQVCIVLRWDT